MITDELIIKTYWKGWKDTLCGINNRPLMDSILSVAYDLGCRDAWAGDDLESVDLQSQEQILNKIKFHANEASIQ